MPATEFRLSEPLAALSVATDLARGRPAGQALRASMVATRLGELLELGPAALATTYFASLLRFAGCTATSHEYAQLLGGDDVAVRFGGDSIDPANAGELGGLLESLGAGSADPGEVMGIVAEGSRADCEVGARLAIRLGLGEDVAFNLLHIFERWDGHGLPNGRSGEGIPLPARIGAVANAIVMFHATGGRAEALRTVERWSGGILDPQVCRAFAAQAEELFGLLESPDEWLGALAAEPSPWRVVGPDRLDDICRVFGDFVDLKTPFFLGHSERVARLAEEAGRTLGLPEDECVVLRRAGLVHDLGRAGISSGIWEKASPLSTLEAEETRLHPYHTERILDRCTLLRPFARLASTHHERMDGSGYFRGLTAASIEQQSRILAAADAVAELQEERPGRPGLALDEIATRLAQEPLDAGAVQAVLRAAGLPNPRVSRQTPAGLTRREVEVLQLLARGQSLRQIADQLVISHSTAHTHAAHVYEKAGITTRAGAALFAMEQGLLN